MRTVAEPLTLADYAALDEDEDEYVTELVRGRVVREPRPGSLHGRTQVELAYHLRAWAQDHTDARVTAESGYILSDEPATVRGPDVAATLEPRPSEDAPGGWIRGAPDVAVEILSPGDTSSGIQEKTLEYLETGARLIWIVDPAARTVTVYRADGSARLLRRTDVLEGEDVLPGFALGLEDLFGG